MAREKERGAASMHVEVSEGVLTVTHGTIPSITIAKRDIFEGEWDSLLVQLKNEIDPLGHSPGEEIPGYEGAESIADFHERADEGDRKRSGAECWIGHNIWTGIGEVEVEL